MTTRGRRARSLRPLIALPHTPFGTLARLPEVREAFNSPFQPFVLATTSVGQEGIDFHWWCLSRARQSVHPLSGLSMQRVPAAEGEHRDRCGWYVGIRHEPQGAVDKCHEA